MQVWSIGRIARRFQTDARRIRYAIESRSVPSIGKCGNANAYSDDAVEQIGKALEEIERNKEGAAAEPAEAK